MHQINFNLSERGNIIPFEFHIWFQECWFCVWLSDTINVIFDQLWLIY